jgi:hypothetical protein
LGANGVGGGKGFKIFARLQPLAQVVRLAFLFYHNYTDIILRFRRAGSGISHQYGQAKSQANHPAHNRFSSLQNGCLPGHLKSLRLSRRQSRLILSARTSGAFTSGAFTNGALRQRRFHQQGFALRPSAGGPQAGRFQAIFKPVIGQIN